MRSLAAALSHPQSLVTDADIIASYSQDLALFSPVGKAVALVRATSVHDVQEVMRFAYTHSVPVVTQGARTGLSGGANAVDGSILLNLENLNRILDVNPRERTCTVEAGVINQDLKDHLRQYELSYPPDPGSVAMSSIGGNVATNAGGLCCVKYGVTRDYVRSLKVVLADGRVTTLGRHTAKGVAGLELSQLFIGSEGTLGIIVEITLDLIPRIPEPLTAMAVFPEVVDASRAVSAFMSTGATPSMVELFDSRTMEIINEYGKFDLPAQAGGMLLVQSNGDGHLEAARQELETFTQCAKEAGAHDVMYSDDPADSAALVAARRFMGKAAEAHAEQHGGGELIDDICLPVARLPEFFTQMEGIRARHPGVDILVGGHAGDGNMHPILVFDKSDPEATDAAWKTFEDIMKLGIELGGTITGEHGVGYLKQRWLAEELDTVSQSLHMAIKHSLDPQGILNPGKIYKYFTSEHPRAKAKQTAENTKGAAS